jgi:hypothetical protein
MCIYMISRRRRGERKQEREKKGYEISSAKTTVSGIYFSWLFNVILGKIAQMPCKPVHTSAVWSGYFLFAHTMLLNKSRIYIPPLCRMEEIEFLHEKVNRYCEEEKREQRENLRIKDKVLLVVADSWREL